MITRRSGSGRSHRSARWWPTASRPALQRGRAALAVQRGPQRDQRIAVDWPTAMRTARSSLSAAVHPGDAFNVTLADELSRNGRRSGLTFARRAGRSGCANGDQQDGHRGGPDPDGHRPPTPGGWRQVKLYFMCGLRPRPTRMCSHRAAGPQGHRGGRRRPGAATSGARCRSAASCPNADTPFQWPPSAPPRWWTPGGARSAARCARTAPTPSRSVPLPRRSGWDHRGPACPRRPPVSGRDPGAWRRGAVSTAWSEHLSFRSAGSGPAEQVLAGDSGGSCMVTTRETLITARCSRGINLDGGAAATGCGRTGRTPSRPRARARWKICRWTPCYEMRACSSMGTEIPGGARPGQRLDGGACFFFPVIGGRCVPNPAGPTPAGAGSAAVPAVQHLVVRYAKAGNERLPAQGDVARAFRAGEAQGRTADRLLGWLHAAPEISYAGGAADRSGQRG